MSKKIGNVIAIIVVVTLLASIVFGCVAACLAEKDETTPLQPHSVGAEYSYGDWEAQHDKAFIVIPGIMASAFYSIETGKETWGLNKFSALLADVLVTYSGDGKTVAEKQAFFEATIKSISCDENQVPYTKQRIANMSDKLAYDSFSATKSVCDLLRPVYGDEYDILTWQYDWRQHSMGAAEELEKFINTYGYEEICFVTHSMGGSVVANYLARSKENRDKVKLYVPFGAPFLGSFSSIDYLFTKENYTIPNADDIDIGEFASGLMSGGGFSLDAIDVGIALINDLLCVNFQMADLTRNIASVYQMLPYAALEETPYYDLTNTSAYVGSSAPITVNGLKLGADTFVKDYLSNLSWAKKEDGTAKPVVADLSAYRQNLYVDNGKGEKVFVTELINTEYIVGVGTATTIGADLNDNGEIKTTYKTTLGDSIIPAYSASAGLPLDDERVHVATCSHNNLMDTTNADFEDTGMVYLLDICAKYL